MAYNNTDVAYGFSSWSASDYTTFTDNLENNGYVYALTQAFGAPSAYQSSHLNTISSAKRAGDVAQLRGFITDMGAATFTGIDVETIDISDTGTPPWGAGAQGYWRLSLDCKIVLTGLGLSTKVSVSLKHHTS